MYVYVCVCICMSKYVNVCQCLSMYVNVFQCLSMSVNVCQCLSMSVIVCRCTYVHVYEIMYIYILYTVYIDSRRAQARKKMEVSILKSTGWQDFDPAILKFCNR